MRIGFDATPLLQPVGGIACYARNLLHAMLELQSEDTFIGYLPPGGSSQVPWPADQYGDYLKWVETRPFRFRGQGERDQLDLYHGTNFKLQTSGRSGTVLTVHDLWLDHHPEYSKKLFGQRRSFFRTNQRIEQATRVIAVSVFTAKEIQEFYKVPAEKISVVPHGLSKDFFPDPGPDKTYRTLRERIGIPDKPFLLFIGGANPRKNHQVLFKAFASDAFSRRGYSLVVVGNPVFKNQTLGKTIHAYGLGDSVCCIAQVSLEELRMLYSRAVLFVFPSKYEGFGFPVLEAMACGVPVVTSCCSALPEVAGDAAILVDPDNAEALACAMRNVLQDADLRKTFREKGLTRAARFDWSRAAEHMLQIYHEIHKTNERGVLANHECLS